MLEANFWQNKILAQKTIKEKKIYEELINSYNDSNKELKDLIDLHQLASSEKNLKVLEEVNYSLDKLLKNSKKNEVK